MAPQKYSVLGYIDDTVFQQCTEAAAYLNKEHADTHAVAVVLLLPFEFEEKRQQLVKDGLLAGEGASAARVVVVMHTPTGNETASVATGSMFIQDVLASTDFRLFELPDDDPNSYRSVAQRNFKQNLRGRGNVYVWMTVKINDVVCPRMVFELFAKTLPRTTANFVHLCKGDVADIVNEATKEKVRLSYKGTNIFRIVKGSGGGWVQGGDVVPPHKGNGGFSCYGPTFPDESFDISHNAKGILGMCNDGEGTNASAFYITLAKSSWMDRSYVAFGRVVEGLDVLDQIANVETKHNQTPAVSVVIDDCGEVSLD